MIPFEIDYEEFPTGAPIKFKHDPKSREELTKKRTVEELLGAIEKYELQDLIVNATFNNDKNFRHIPIPGRLKKRRDGYYIIIDGIEQIKADFMDNEQLEEVVAKHPLSCISTILYHTDDGDHVYVMTFDSANDRKKYWETSEESWMPIVTLFLEETGINTLHKLGKAINKGTELHDEFRKTNGWE